MINSLSKTRGLIYSQRVLLELMKKGLTAKRLMKLSSIAPCRFGRRLPNSRMFCIATQGRKYLRPAEIDACFDIKYYTRYRDLIYKRVGLK